MCLVVAGCFPISKTPVQVADLESLFPTIERLGLKVYVLDTRNSSTCEYFSYVRGAFSSDPANDLCAAVNVDSLDTGTTPPANAFDKAALADLDILKNEFRRINLPRVNLNIALLDGVIKSGAFAADRCVAYFYEPGWSGLPPDVPGDAKSTAIDRNWYKIDSCPD